MTVIINNKEYDVKYNLRAMFVFEQIADKKFEISTIFDEYVLFYSCLIAGGADDLDFNFFIDYCDEHPELISDFSDYMIEESKKRSKFDKEDKKKVEVEH